MKLLGEPTIVFNDYKKTGLYLALTKCNFKCVKEAKAKGLKLIECQNHSLANQKSFLNLSTQEIYDFYISTNPFIECVIMSGLDPIDSWNEGTIEFIDEFRKISDMEIVIFTGYYPNEIEDKLNILKTYKNITIKFGRYSPEVDSRFDDIGEVNLISGNQYFQVIS